ncbi:MAG: hypothetical protein ABIH37_02650 [archaeon]
MVLENKKILILVIIIIVVILLIVLFVVFNIFKPLSSPVIEEECKIIVESEGENKIDIVFLTDKVNEKNVDNYIDYLLSSEPYSENKDKFNFYYAGETDCDILREFLYCYSKKLIKKSSICPNDYIIVLADEVSSIRSSAYINVISLNINHNKNVVLHEFGHIFGNLADEYVPSVFPKGAENCVRDCDSFKDYGVNDCYEGCTKSNYYRSSEDSVMKTLRTEDYKELNIILLKEILEKYE